MHRRWIDPTAPFAAEVAEPAHGLLVTSATLRDSAREPEEAWQAAELRTGAQHLAAPAIRAAAPSPFDYPAQTRALVVTDVRRDSAGQVAAACRSLFLAAGGGALGLFTAVARLRAVHGLLAEPLDAAGIPLIAQHVDRMDVATLIDIFRAEPDSCPAWHGRRARRGGRAGQGAAPHRVRPRALAAADHPAQSEARAFRRRL